MLKFHPGLKQGEGEVVKEGKKQLREHWPLGFLALLGIRGLPGLFRGDCLEMAWLAWFAWLVFFIPLKTRPAGKKDEAKVNGGDRPAGQKCDEPCPPGSEAKKKDRHDEEDDESGLFIPAGLFFGLGLGFLFEQLLAGLFIGLGTGFLCMAIAKTVLARHKSKNNG